MINIPGVACNVGLSIICDELVFIYHIDQPAILGSADLGGGKIVALD